MRRWTWEPAPSWARRGALHLNGQPCTFLVLNFRRSCPDAELSPPPGYPDNVAIGHKSSDFGVLARPRFRLARILLRKCNSLQNL